MSDEPFEIISDETIELLDENKEHVLIRMTRIQSKLDRNEYNIVFDSRNRFYLIGGHHFPIKTHKLENFYYSSYYGLSHVSHFVYNITNSFRCGFHIQKFKIIYKYLYDNRNEYCPCYGLTNFELK